MSVARIVLPDKVGQAVDMIRAIAADGFVFLKIYAMHDGTGRISRGGIIGAGWRNDGGDIARNGNFLFGVIILAVSADGVCRGRGVVAAPTKNGIAVSMLVFDFLGTCIGMIIDGDGCDIFRLIVGQRHGAFFVSGFVSDGAVQMGNTGHG